MDVFEKRKDTCPPGYKLAKLDDPEVFNQASIFVFGCMGPSAAVWISTAMGTVYSEGDPITLIAPDAIEKGGLFIQARKETKSTRHLKTKRPTQFEKAAIVQERNIRIAGNVILDSSDSHHPFLCEKTDGIF